ncbi:GDSL-type esterase/lipase family protein [Spirochaeta cellobiosiphila]|uniref:GDSL-type esterase/lipase family protein n=1 Tax=Spirochaeta cellobiosiphila TaxID=504483 RepID=UPI0004193344|nr:GDSL-type esterase/lipase family protein [Spirochaeta cellobiosiphila]
MPQSLSLIKHQHSFELPDEELQLDIKTSHHFKSIKWVSSDPYVAQVSATGLVTSVAGGRATIYAYVENQPDICDSCLVDLPDVNRPSSTDYKKPQHINDDTIEIIMCGDSMMRTYDTSYGYDQCGWGQLLSLFFDYRIIVNNNIPMGGRSSRSFYTESVRWPVVRELLAANKKTNIRTMVFMQFGHNDQKLPAGDGRKYLSFAKTNQNGSRAGTYTDYLERYILEIRELGAIPVFFTPFVRKYFEKGELLQKGQHNLTTPENGESKARGNYPQAMKDIACKHNVPVIDITSMSRDYVSSVYKEEGEEGLLNIYSYDSTHTRTLGSLRQAEMAIKGLVEANILEEYIMIPDSRLMIDGGMREFEPTKVGDSSIINIRITQFNITDGVIHLKCLSDFFQISLEKNGEYGKELTLSIPKTGQVVYAKFQPLFEGHFTGSINVSYEGSLDLIPDFGTSAPGTKDKSSVYVALQAVGDSKFT